MCNTIIYFITIYEYPNKNNTEEYIEKNIKLS